MLNTNEIIEICVISKRIHQNLIGENGSIYVINSYKNFTDLFLICSSTISLFGSIIMENFE